MYCYRSWWARFTKKSIKSRLLNRRRGTHPHPVDGCGIKMVWRGREEGEKVPEEQKGGRGGTPGKCGRLLCRGSRRVKDQWYSSKT